MNRQPLKTSPAGLALLKAYEKLRLDVYLDEKRRPTIYWGHLIRPGERFNHTAAEADQYLVRDLGWAEDCVNVFAVDKVPVPLTQNQFDALVVFTYNVGAAAFQTSTLRKLLLVGNLAGAADQFLRWDKEIDPATGQVHESEGLLKRRTAERHLFLGEPWSPP